MNSYDVARAAVLSAVIGTLSAALIYLISAALGWSRWPGAVVMFVLVTGPVFLLLTARRRT